MFDIDASAIALGVHTTEEMCTIAGTWSINEYIAKEPVMDGSTMNSLYAIPGYYLVEECSATSAGNLEWYLTHYMKEEPLLPGEQLYDAVNRMVETVLPEECEVYFLPFLYASNAHPLGKGTFAGLTLYHGKEHMLRAIYEGVAFSHKTHIDRLLVSRERPQAIRMAGGAVNSQVWVQMFADVLGVPIETVQVKELGALGCAMAAMVVAGVYKDYPEAVAHMVHVSKKVEPDPKATRIYQQKYETYCKVSKALDMVWSDFAV
jgi:L-xylulokinase